MSNLLATIDTWVKAVASITAILVLVGLGAVIDKDHIAKRILQWSLLGVAIGFAQWIIISWGKPQSETLSWLDAILTTTLYILGLGAISITLEGIFEWPIRRSSAVAGFFFGIIIQLLGGADVSSIMLMFGLMFGVIGYIMGVVIERSEGW